MKSSSALRGRHARHDLSQQDKVKQTLHYYQSVGGLHAPSRRGATSSAWKLTHYAPSSQPTALSNASDLPGVHREDPQRLLRITRGSSCRRSQAINSTAIPAACANATGRVPRVRDRPSDAAALSSTTPVAVSRTSLGGPSPHPPRHIDMSKEPHDSATLSRTAHLPPCRPAPTTQATPPPTPPTKPTTPAAAAARSSARGP
jgi:hypothetical protein